MSNQWYGSATGGMTLNVVPTEPMKTPTGLLVTRAVETKDGWVGQIVVDKTIVWESEGVPNDDDRPETGERKAVKAANERVVGALARLFA